MAELMAEAMPGLREMADLSEYWREISRLENEADQTYRRLVTELGRRGLDPVCRRAGFRRPDPDHLHHHLDVHGVGATKRLSAVRWGVAKNIVTGRLLTFPGAGPVAA